MGKIGALVLVSLVIVMLTAVGWASTAACSDGTLYYQCSKTQPGYACLPDQASGNNILQNDVQMKIVKDSHGTPKCACANFDGYAEVSGACVKTTCSDPNGQQIASGLCASNKPKRCMNGQLADDATSCGCPAGQQASPDGKACVTSSGCHWNNPACPADQECKFIASDATDPGICKPKQGCAFGTVTCLDSQTCDKSTNPNGLCKTKDGCLYLNPICTKGQVCVNNVCQAAPAPGSSGDSTLPTQTTNSTASSSNANPLSCCCLPGAGAGAAVGLALLRRKDENEE